MPARRERAADWAGGYVPRMSPDDPGVMGNLPRSRPGRRSSKRGGDAAAGESTESSAAKPATTAKATSSTSSSAKSGPSRPAAKKTTPRRPAAKPTTASGAKPAGSARTRARATESPTAEQPASRQPSGGGTDPVTGAVMLAGKVVEGGLKVAGGIIKRLPRP